MTMFNSNVRLPEGKQQRYHGDLAICRNYLSCEFKTVLLIDDHIWVFMGLSTKMGISFRNDTSDLVFYGVVHFFCRSPRW